MKIYSTFETLWIILIVKIINRECLLLAHPLGKRRYKFINFLTWWCTKKWEIRRELIILEKYMGIKNKILKFAYWPLYHNEKEKDKEKLPNNLNNVYWTKYHLKLKFQIPKLPAKTYKLNQDQCHSNRVSQPPCYVNIVCIIILLI